MKGKIHIEGFKCFLGQDIPINDLTVLAGGNSVGKSSVVQSLLLLRSALEKRNGDKQIPLNGDFQLSLGNSAEVLARGAASDRISISYKNKQSFFSATFECDIRDPQVFIKLNKLDKQDVFKYTLPIDNLHFHYLHAERLGPRPFYNIGAKQRNVGWQGEYAISLLSSKIADTPEYDVSQKKIFPGTKNHKLKFQINKWMDYIVPGTNLTAKRVEEINRAFAQYNDDAPFNVGFGISYILPIIAAGLIARPNEMFIVENPEAHLHPSGQSRIGGFLAKIASDGVQVIIETHSEHVINGIRLAALKKDIEHEKVVINFFSNTGAAPQPEIRTITLNENADLDNWPKGFFDQQQQDIATIFKLRKENNK